MFNSVQVQQCWVCLCIEQRFSCHNLVQIIFTVAGFFFAQTWCLWLFHAQTQCLCFFFILRQGLFNLNLICCIGFKYQYIVYYPSRDSFFCYSELNKPRHNTCLKTTIVYLWEERQPIKLSTGILKIHWDSKPFLSFHSYNFGFGLTLSTIFTSKEYPLHLK